MKQDLYFDNAAITQPSNRAIEESLWFHQKHWGSFSAPHRLGTDLHPYVKRSYQRIYDCLGAHDEASVIFCASQTEAINHVFFSVYHDISREKGKNHFLTAVTDEAPQMLCMSRLEDLGASVDYLKVSTSGTIDLETLEEALTPRTALLSLSWANAMTGVVHPIEELGQLCRERGVLFHVDASHVLGRVPLNVSQLPVDFLTFGGHLIHGFKGTGALYIKEGLSLSPFILGGLEQAALRGGELDVSGLYALGVACQEAKESVDFVGFEIARLKAHFEKALKNLPFSPKVLFEKSLRLPTITCVAFPGIHQDALLFYLNHQHLYASFGGGNFQKLSMLLEASGLPESQSQSALNFTLSKNTTPEEVKRALGLLEKAGQYFSKVSPK